jgi:hypothetical protein
MFAWICPKCGKEIPPQYDGCPEWCPEYDKQKAYLKQSGPSPVEATSPIVKNLIELDSKNKKMGGGTYTGATFLSGGTFSGTMGVPASAPQPQDEGARYKPAAAAISYEDSSAGLPSPEARAMASMEQIRGGGGPYAGGTSATPNPDHDGRREMNPLLVTALATIVFIALGYAAFKYYESSKGSFGASAGMVQLSGSEGGHRLNRILSVTGLRFVPGKDKKLEARFVIVNSSGAQTPTFSGVVNIRPRDAAPNETPMLTFDLEKLSLGPYESREIQAPLNTNLKPYELPDGNLIRSDLLITEPAE